MKNQWGYVAIFLVIVLVISSEGIQLGGFDFADFFRGGADTGLANVNKPIQFHFVNKYSGGPIASKSNTFDLYDSDGKTPLETSLDTDGDGECTTSSPYPSGKTLYMRYESSNDKQWWKFTVPQMNEKDAESATNNLLRLDSFTIGTYTTDGLKIANGTTYADASTYDISNDSDNPHFTYSLANTGSDNTGLMNSRDPEYGQNWNVELYITFSGTDYEKLIIYDLDYDFTLGTTHYVGKTLNPYSLTLHKQGFSYLSLGTQDTSFWIDTTGASGSCSVTMQITAVAYGDHIYAQAHGGSFGPEAITIAEQTVTIQA